jgi:hypothetical protein
MSRGSEDGNEQARDGENDSKQLRDSEKGGR